MPSELEDLGDGTYRVVNDYAQVLFLDADGTITEGYGPNGEELDVAGLAYNPDVPTAAVYEAGYEPEPEPYVDQAELTRAAELEARLHLLEERANQPVVMIAGDRTEYDGEAIVEEMERQSAQLESWLGRRLVLDERRDLGTEVVNAVRLGHPVDIEAAAERLAIEDRGGLRHGDMNNDQERHDYYGSRLRDLDRLSHQEQRNDDLGAPLPPPDETEFNLENDQQRVQYMTQRLQDQEAYAVEPAEDDFS